MRSLFLKLRKDLGSNELIMNNSRFFGVFCVTAYAILSNAVHPCFSAELSVTVSSISGSAVEGAVIMVEATRSTDQAQTVKNAIMDQRKLQFVPDVLIVQTGTSVDFPNSDQVRHQVYSFSGAKKFTLALYAGHRAAPVLFDHAGLVTLGCNIHDDMLGYIWVTDSPWYGRTAIDGRLQLSNIPAGDYTLRIWHALLNQAEPPFEQPLSIIENHSNSVTHQFTRVLRQPPQHHGANKTWQDY